MELVLLMRVFALESGRLLKRACSVSLALQALFATLSPALAWNPQVPAVPHRLGTKLVAESEYLPLSRASKLMQQGHHAKALIDLTTTVEQNPANILGLFHLGTAYLELAKTCTLPAQQAIYLEQAEQAFERVRDLNSDLTLTYFKLGKIALMKNDIAGAKQAYQQGLEADPNNAALLFNLARVYDQNEEKTQAMHYYQQTLQVDPQFIYAYNNLALLYEDLHDFAQAEKTYLQALKKNKTYNLARLNLGNLYASNGHYLEAQKTLKEAQALEPDNEWVYFYQGNLYLRMSLYRDAAEAYNQALDKNPRHATTYYLLAVALSKLNQMEDAMQASLHYIQLAPDGEFAKEMKSLIMAVKLSQSTGIMFTQSAKQPQANRPQP